MQFPISAREVAVTAFWSKWMAEHTSGKNATPTAEVTITPADICYLHQRSCCKYGVDCKHVHLCRARFAKVALELGRLASGGNTAATPAPGASPAVKAAQPVLRERLMGANLSLGKPESSGGATTALPPAPAPAPAALRGALAAEKPAGFVPLTSWRKGSPQPRPLPEAPVAPCAAGASRPKPVPVPLEPAHVLPPAGVGLEEREARSPTTADSIAKRLIAMSNDWEEPSRCEEVVEKALQHERSAWAGRRAGSSRLSTWGSSLTSPVRV